MFRLSRKAFSDLVLLLRADIRQFSATDGDREIQAHESGKAIEADIKVGIFLRMMAGGSFHNFMVAYSLSCAAGYQSFGVCLDAASRRLSWQTFSKSTDERAFRNLSLQFTASRKLSNPLPGCVGSVDGIHFKIEKAQLVALRLSQGIFFDPVAGHGRRFL